MLGQDVVGQEGFGIEAFRGFINKLTSNGSGKCEPTINEFWAEKGTRRLVEDWHCLTGGIV